MYPTQSVPLPEKIDIKYLFPLFLIIRVVFIIHPPNFMHDFVGPLPLCKQLAS